MHSGRTLHEIFEERAAQFPGRTAVSCGTEHLDYAALNARADRLARRIAATRKGPGGLVGLCADRGIELIVGLLAILKAGAGYVPLDPGYPAERLDHLLADTQVDLVLALGHTARAVASADAPVLLIDGTDGDSEPDTALPRTGADSLAYVIHTSGSTGRPKGTLIEHGNVVALMEQGRELFGFDENDVWTLFHSVSFDFSVWEIWGPCCTAAVSSSSPPRPPARPSCCGNSWPPRASPSSTRPLRPFAASPPSRHSTPARNSRCASSCSVVSGSM